METGSGYLKGTDGIPYFEVLATGQGIVEHLSVLSQALELYELRDHDYRAVWKAYGALSNLVRAATKIDRLMAVWWHGTQGELPTLHKDALDDAYDAINYLTFFIRCANEENFTGKPQVRPGV